MRPTESPPLFMARSMPSTRTPNFMAGKVRTPRNADADFSAVLHDRTAGAVEPAGSPLPIPPESPGWETAEVVSPPESVEPSAGAIEFGERIAAAVGALRLTSERLGEQVRADAVELSLMLARRIVETELSTNVEPLFGIVRNAVKRLGETRKIVVQLCPQDAERVERAGAGRLSNGLSTAEISIAADPSLGPGDCVIQSDAGVIDGRLSVRFDELRRVIDESFAQEASGGLGGNR